MKSLYLFVFILFLLASCASNQKQTQADTRATSEPNATSGFVAHENPPVMIGQLRPEYPLSARNAGIQGTVILEVQVLKDGSVSDVKVKRSVQQGQHGLDEAAINAVKKVRFKPGMSSGAPVDTMVVIPVSFRLN